MKHIKPETSLLFAFFLLLSGPYKLHAVDVVLSFTELVFVNGGMYTRGSPESEEGRLNDEGPRHHVVLDPFYIGKYEVTRREYGEVMNQPNGAFLDPGLPAENVSWLDAVLFCNTLSEWEGLEPAYTIDENGRVNWNREASGYRLPTEAEWEYACRAGTSSPFFTGKSISVFEANYNGEIPYAGGPKGENRGKALPAGSFSPNLWGIHDTHGNAAEWCWDYFGNYQGIAETNPQGPASGIYRVLRGGSWLSGGNELRSAARSRAAPSTRESNIGFRVARNSGRNN